MDGPVLVMCLGSHVACVSNPKNFKKARWEKTNTLVNSSPHQVRVGNIHELQAGVDVTKVLTEGLKPFDDTVTTSLLYASGTWTPTAEIKKKLQATQ